MQQKINKKSLHEKLSQYSLITTGVVVSTILILTAVILFYKGIIPYIYLRALIFVYVLSLIILIGRIFFLLKVKNFSDSIGFKFITPFYLEPKIEGTYKKNWFQIHYVSKEAGKDPSLLRTYIKLQYKKPMCFDTSKLDAYDDSDWKSHRILTIKHINRGYKNYLLLKRKWFLFDKDKLFELMDLLIKVSKETELKS
ncbi:MAG: hypothetical protein AABW92_03430 [Nanoarchaeota archaeon]